MSEERGDTGPLKLIPSTQTHPWFLCDKVSAVCQMDPVASGDGGLVSEFALSGGSDLPLWVLMVAAAFEGECHPVSGTGHQPLATMKTGL